MDGSTTTTTDFRDVITLKVEDDWAHISALDPEKTRYPTPKTMLVSDDAFKVLELLPANSIQAVVTDPPYGLIEYEKKDHDKLRTGKGGVWRQPQELDGYTRAPVPRFTVLTDAEAKRLVEFMQKFAKAVHRVLVPGGHMMVAANPLLSTTVFGAVMKTGLEKRGEIIRLVQTLRGGDRPKGDEKTFADVTVMPRSCWEPWGLFRKALSEKTVSANLKRWGTGGLRRISEDEPFKDVIKSAPTHTSERASANHPSLKPQAFMRQVVRAALPLGIGIVLDPFAGGGSTLAAAEHLGYYALGCEIDPAYSNVIVQSVGKLAQR